MKRSTQKQIIFQKNRDSGQSRSIMAVVDNSEGKFQISKFPSIKGDKQPSTVEVRGRARRAEGLGPPTLVKSLEPARTPVTSYQLPPSADGLFQRSALREFCFGFN